MMVTLLFCQALALHQADQLSLLLDAGAARVRGELHTRVDARMHALRLLAREWEGRIRPDREAWEADAELVMAQSPEVVAIEWLDAFEAIGLDGVVAKRLDAPYRAGERTAVVKVKPEKTADCVVAGVRWKADGERRIATLLLGLYDDDGHLDYVGSAAVAPARHDEIAAAVLPLLRDAPERRFSEPNRWGGGELEEAAVRPELVVEIAFSDLQSSPRYPGGLALRLARVKRYRDDKRAQDADTMESVRRIFDAQG